MSTGTRVHFVGLDWTQEEKKSRIGNDQRRSRQAAKRMMRNSERAREEARLKELEELQLFRSFLNRMGEAARRELLRQEAAVRFQCQAIFLHEGDALDQAVDGFVGRPHLTGIVAWHFPPRGAGIAGFTALRQMMQDMNAVQFKYTPLDRFLQFLFNNEGTLRENNLNPNVEGSVDAQIFREMFQHIDVENGDYMGHFCRNYKGQRSGTIPADSMLPQALNLLEGALVAAQAYERADGETGPERALASSGSEDTEEREVQ